MLREAFYYLLGGVTFLPLCVLAFVLHHYFYAPSVLQTQAVTIAKDVDLNHETKLAALDLAAKNAALHDEIEKSHGKDLPQGTATAPSTAKRLGPKPSSSTTTVKPFSSGWLTVRSKFESDKDAAPAPPAAAGLSQVDDGSQEQPDADTLSLDSTDSASTLNKAVANSSGYMSQMYRGILDYRIGKPGAKKPSEQSGRSTTAAAGPTSTPTGTAGRESFYCILKAPILYLYSSDDVSNPATECHAAIDLRGKRVSIYVSGVGDTLGELDQPRETDADAEESSSESSKAPTWQKARRAMVRDGELFMKRNAIRIVGSATGRSRSPVPKDDTSRPGRSRRRPQWFIFCKNNYFMEDWYHALVQSSLMPEIGTSAKSDEGDAAHLPAAFKETDDPVGTIFSRDDMASLLVSLDNLSDPLPLRWLNALVGRIFFSIYRTAWLENYITSKIMKKLTRVKTPGFLGDIKVEEVDVGRRAPAFSRPMLKALTDEGEASMEIALHYVGEIRITISTTLSFSLGSRFKAYSIPIVLAVVLRSLEGNLLLHVKPPPSNRLWFGFTAMPKIELDIEPVVSERKVQWGMVTRLIESRFRELLLESIVVPNMDDMPFFDTRAFFFRGGIFADAVKNPEPATSVAATVSAVAAASGDTGVIPTETAGFKPSDATLVPNAAASSAPVSGVATPVSANVGEEESIDADDATSTATRADTALRNRKVGSGPQPVPTISNRVSSPAIAGLSDLLSRDLAAGGGGSGSQLSTSGSPPRIDSKSAAKRKLWFGASPRTSTGGIPSTGLSALGLAAGSLGVRGHRDQGSLAMGNASIERPGNRANSVIVPEKVSDLGVDAKQPGIVRQASTAAPESSSIAPIVSSDAAGQESGAADTTNKDAGEALLSVNSLQDRVGESSSRGASSGAPSLVVSEAAQDGGSTQDSSALRPTLDLSGVSRAAVLSDAAVQDFVNSPASLTHSTRSPASSAHGHDRGAPPADGDASSVSGQHRSAQSSLYPASSAASMRSDVSEADDGTRQSSARSTQYGFTPPPPPPRRPAAKVSPAEERPRYQQDAASSLSNVQKSRYGLGEGYRDVVEENAAPAMTSAALWSKAKASMADKDSRQAAAKEAKDAIKRGWSSWNAKRAEAKRGQQVEPEYTGTSANDSMTRSHASRMSLVPGQSAWLASSPPDPTSFGLGFDKASPEDRRNMHILPALPPHARQSGGDNDEDNTSAHSSSSGRQPYREHRAYRKTVPSGGERESDENNQRLAPRSMLPSASTPGLMSDMHGDSILNTTGQWAADLPSLLAPAPAAYKAEEDTSLERKVSMAESTTSQTLTDNAASGDRPRLPGRKISTSISSTGSASFIPTAPSTTTGLASTEGVSSSTSQDSVLDRYMDDMDKKEDSISASQGSARESSRSPSSSSRVQATESEKVVPATESAAPTDAPTMRSGIKKQPARAAMMAVPGIPSMQKAGPQSFSAPPAAPKQQADSSPTLRRSSLFKIPSFASPSGMPASLPPSEADTQQSTTLSSSDAEPVSKPESKGLSTAEEQSFATVAKAEGPSADPAFEEALMDRGAEMKVGNATVKVADGSRDAVA